MRRVAALVVGAVALGVAPAASARLQYVRSWPVGGSHDYPDPEGVAVDHARGVVYVSDFDGGIVQRYTLTGRYLGRFGSDGIRRGQLDGPADLCVDPLTGNVFVSEQALNSYLGVTYRVSEFTARGRLIRTIGGPGIGPGKFDSPGPVGIDPATGQLYIDDYGHDRVQVFTTTGRFVRVFGEPHPTFAEPFGMAFDPGPARLEIAATARSGRYTPGGRKVASLKNYLQTVAILPATGDLAVLNSSFGPQANMVFVYRPDGRLIDATSRPGSTGQYLDPQEDALTAAAADCDGYVYATDSVHFRLLVFRDPAMSACPRLLLTGKAARVSGGRALVPVFCDGVRGERCAGSMSFGGPGAASYSVPGGASQQIAVPVRPQATPGRAVIVRAIGPGRVRPDIYRVIRLN